MKVVVSRRRVLARRPVLSVGSSLAVGSPPHVASSPSVPRSPSVSRPTSRRRRRFLAPYPVSSTAFRRPSHVVMHRRYPQCCSSSPWKVKKKWGKRSKKKREYAEKRGKRKRE